MDLSRGLGDVYKRQVQELWVIVQYWQVHYYQI
jgi:hypothetical protein